MIYIVDPTLRSTAPAKKISYTSTAKVIYSIFGICAVLALGWFLITLRSSRLDTVPDNTIKIDPRLESIPLDDRQKPIRTTL